MKVQDWSNYWASLAQDFIPYVLGAVLMIALIALLNLLSDRENHDDSDRSEESQ